jgi:hypothetical protein
MADRKLYNGGDRLSERFPYSPKPADKDVNWIAYRDIDAPAHDFFFVPDEVTGPQYGRVPVNFAMDLATKHGHRGIVLIDAAMATDAEDDTPFAKDEKDAKEKGERLWHNHLVRTVQNHIDYCAGVRSQGGAPRAASHFTRRAFKLLKLQDPGETIFEGITVRSTERPNTEPKKDEAAELREKIADLTRQNELLKKNADDKAKK